ncbi:MAG: acetyl-coenzyme A synthetase N-terminal domain-containing protein, partial [Candidatus Puniceispirillaceae bacterium]
MTQDRLFAPGKETVENALIDDDGYKAMYADSIADPDAFWAEHGRRIDWIRPYSQISDVSYDAGDLHINWYADGTLNAAANCLDRHLATRGDQTAIIWEGDDPADSRHITYAELHEEVCRFANVLKAEGAKKGDR